jgi:heme a synthase
LTAIHLVHRGMAFLVVALLLGLAWAVRRDLRQQGAQPSRATQAMAGLALVQVATGLSNVVFEWPLFAALLHTAGAAALWMLMVWLLASFHASAAAAVAPPIRRVGVAA